MSKGAETSVCKQCFTHTGYCRRPMLTHPGGHLRSPVTDRAVTEMHAGTALRSTAIVKPMWQDAEPMTSDKGRFVTVSGIAVAEDGAAALVS